jgi:hypothetical protein
LDSELFISASKAQRLRAPFESIVAKLYRIAQDQTKPQMVKVMISRVLRGGV